MGVLLSEWEISRWWSERDIIDRFVRGGYIPDDGRFGDPRDGGKREHNGIDICRPRDTDPPDVPAGVSGTVTDVVQGKGTFNTVYIRASDGYTFKMLHFDTIYVKKGDPVEPGSAIGRMGGWGRLSPEKNFDVHLHLEIFDPNGRHVDPLAYGWGYWLPPPSIVIPPFPPPTGGNAG